jgi:hypothetical protein
VIRDPRLPEPRQCLTSPALLLQTAKRHNAVVVTVDGYLSAIVYRPCGEAILWRAPVRAA